MSAESLLGGGNDQGQNLDQETLDLLNSVLTDTQGGSSSVTPVGGTTFVSGTGADNETQSVLLPGSGAVTGTINDGALAVEIELPAGIGLALEGLPTAVNSATMETYLQSQIDAVLPATSNDPTVIEYRESLQSALSNIMAALNTEGVTNAVVRLVYISDTSTTRGAGNMVFDASGSAKTEVLAINIGDLGAGKTLNLLGVEKAAIIGSGSVAVGDNKGSLLQGDILNQKMTGGGGNDTLVGGGGSDTLVGGAGNDTFGFNHVGNYTISDFTSNDKFAFQFAGINSFNALAALVTRYEAVGNDTVVEFGGSLAGLSITLVGVSPNAVTADMIKFGL